jgi:spoIIIJ-associated protein
MPNQNESLDVNAKTVDEAIEQGLNQLGLTRDQVDIQIINEAKRTLFGFKSEEALVRLTPRSQAKDSLSEAESSPPDTGPPDEITVSETDESASPQPDETPLELEGKTAEETLSVESPDGTISAEDGDLKQKVAEIGQESLAGLLEHMGIKAKITTRMAPDLVDPGEEPPLVLDVTGKDLGILIGRRNETLQALQYMVRLMVNKRMASWQRIVVDVESYRARRRNSLRKIANRMAERAVTNGERVVLEAMPAYERRLIHIALRNHPAVFTKSIGRDKNRKVTIIPK